MAPHRLGRWLALGLAPWLGSCVFLLDYDELQSGSVSPDVQGGASAEGGSVSATGGGGEQAGGAGGAAPACGDCDDQDPCTIDICDEMGDAPECLHEPSEGLRLDGFQQVLWAEQHLRVSLAASTDTFYLAELEVNETVPDVALYELASDGTELEPLGARVGETLPMPGKVLSNVGLAVDPTLGGIALHGFVAVQPDVGDGTPKVFHLVHRAGKTTATLVGASYRAENPWIFPQALAIGNAVVGAWIQADGSIAVSQVGGATSTFGDATLPATTLSLLSTADDRPAVLFTAQDATTTFGTYVETGGMNRSKVVECQAAPGTYLSSSAIGTQIPGIWLTSVTKAGDDFLTSQGATVVCGNNACVATTDSCEDEDLANGARNIAGATVQAGGEGIVYSVIAVPQLALKAGSDTELEARLSLALGRADFSGGGPPESTTIGGDAQGFLEIARQATDEARSFAGPDWPAVAILPTRRALVSWIQPSDRGGSELHVQRYRMCVPEE